jgi:endonuclease/exonuclease/phosphatase family metal-dependent hydrolase
MRGATDTEEAPGVYASVRTLAVAAATVVGLLVGAVPTAQASAPRSAPTDDVIRVATYNVMKTTRLANKWSWSKRRLALVNTVRDASPDVLMVQEANLQRWAGGTHLDDVRGLLGSLGYQITSTDYSNCTPGCTRGAHIFFAPSRMSLAALPTGAPAAGMAGMSTIAGVDFGGTQDRNASYAFLTPVGSSRTTLFISAHLPTEKNGEGERLRVAVASALRPWADGLIAGSGLSGVNIVIGGDFNSFQRRQPYGAQQVLANTGLIDGFAAPVKVNGNYSTVNYTPKTRKYKGFPPRPYFYGRDTTRIDYIFSTVAPHRHEVVLRLTAKGKFDNNYRASDHNMVMVDLPLR